MDSPPQEQKDDNQNEPMEDEFGQKVIKTRELTVLEKEYFEKARKKQKENIFREQVVQGKTFKGQGFISKPAEINFKDFDVGRSHTIVMQLTNVSFTFNSFKIIPLQESIRDFFEILYTPPGRISAGMSCPITIRFTPQLNDDIQDKLQLYAETGPIEINLICTSKKAIARCDNPVVDFGKVIYGEDHQAFLKIQNHGALETDIIIKSSKGNDIMTRTETSSQASGKRQRQPDNMEEDRQLLESQLSQLKFQKAYNLTGYSVLNIPMKYIPNEIGSYELPLMVYFDNFMHSPPINILIRGECIQVPIYVQNQVYDFQICLFSHIYREKIVFFNRSSNAMKIQIVSPKETKQFFEFNPKLGYIQGNSKFEIWVKFNADRDIVNMCSSYLKNDILEIPFKLIGADQKMPVFFTIKAHMTSSSLQITPGKIDFGKIFEGQASRHQITFENLAELPQELIIYPLPKEIQISMDLLPIKLLPKQKFQTDLIYRSQKVIGNDNDRQDDGYLKCKIITGSIATKEIRVPYCCEILKCPLEFSALRIDFPALQIEECHSTTVEIKNLSQRDIIFEFFLPYYEISGLSMTPMVWQIQRDNTFQVHLEYRSFFKKLGAYTLQEIKNKYENDITKNFDLRLKVKYEEEERKRKEEEEAKKEEELAKQGKGSKKQDKKEVKKEAKAPQLTKAQQQQLEIEQQRQAELEKQKEEEERIRREEFEKEFNSPKELYKLGGKLKEFGKGPDDPNYNQHYSWLIPCYFKYCDMPDVAKQVIYLQIETVSVQKSLLLTKTLIDFEEIAVGISITKELRITNNSPFAAEMKMEMLPISCGFTILNALRTIQPGQFKNLVVQFQPREEQPFDEILKLYCSHGCVSAKLKGKGVRPEVKVFPENGLINIGGVLLGEYAERSFKISNVSNFAIKFQLLSKGSGTGNLNGTEVFSFIPSEAIVPAREEMTVKLIFKPDRISDQFYELISIDVPNQKDEKRLLIWGSCYNRQAYVNNYKPYLQVPSPASLNKKPESPFDILKIKDEDRIYSPSNNKIILEFQRVKEGEPQSEQAFTRKIVVGSCRLLDTKLEKPSNFEIIMPKDEKGSYFQCDNLKGTAVAGAETIITFTFKPSQIDQFMANIEALQSIGQWKEAKVELKLSGGALKPNVSDLWTFEIYLRAFVNQI